MLQRVAACCSVLVRCSVLQWKSSCFSDKTVVQLCCSVLQCFALCYCVVVCCSEEAPSSVIKLLSSCGAVWCNVLQCVVVFCSVVQCVASVLVCCSVLQCVAVCCGKGAPSSMTHCCPAVLQYVAVCCSVLQCVTTYCSLPLHQIKLPFCSNVTKKKKMML